MEKKGRLNKYVDYIKRKKEARMSLFYTVCYVVFITVLLVFGTKGHAQTPGIYIKVKEPKTDVFIRPMERMMTNIYNLKMTGDFDKDYVAIMKEFQEGGKDLTGIYQRAGEDPRLIENAKVSKVELKEHQKQLNNFYSPTRETSPRKHGEMIATLNKMMDEMKRKGDNGDLDMDYATVMTLYNWAGSELAKSELRHGLNAELHETSKELIEEFADNQNDLMSWFGKYSTASK
jgi:uncharacterized protein (DUF305 family)